MQLTLQAANNRNRRAALIPPAPHQVMHLEPFTLQGVTSLDHLKAVFPNPEDHIMVTFDPDNNLAKLDLSTSRLTTWNGNAVNGCTMTIARGAGKHTLNIRGLQLLVSLQ